MYVIQTGDRPCYDQQREYLLFPAPKSTMTPSGATVRPGHRRILSNTALWSHLIALVHVSSRGSVAATTITAETSSMATLLPTATTTVTSKTPPIFLTPTTYDDLTANNTVLIKWAAPWCSHSQDLAPIWNRLVATDFSNHGDNSLTGNDKDIDVETPSLLLAEVDCDENAHADWCTAMSYTAFPTLTYGDPSMDGIFLQTYQSLDKSYETLVQWVRQELWNRSFCTPGNMAACSSLVKTRMEAFWNMTTAELEASIEMEESLVERAQDHFDDATKTLKAEYDRMSQQHEATTARYKRKVKLLQSVANSIRKKAT